MSSPLSPESMIKKLNQAHEDIADKQFALDKANKKISYLLNRSNGSSSFILFISLLVSLLFHFRIPLLSQWDSHFHLLSSIHPFNSLITDSEFVHLSHLSDSFTFTLFICFSYNFTLFWLITLRRWLFGFLLVSFLLAYSSLFLRLLV